MGSVLRNVYRTLLLCLPFIFLPATVFSEPYWIFFECEQNRKPGNPVSEDLLRAVAETGFRIRTVSRYFNAVSVDVEGEPGGLESIERVREIRPVRRLTRIPGPTVQKPVYSETSESKSEEHTLSYGSSYRQLDALNIPRLHDMGISGNGVVVGVLDTGFDIEGTGCLENIVIADTWNFITASADVTGDHHGTHVLACLGGAREGSYYGPAFNAAYLLAVTDDVDTETRADEDRWVAAVEWCDSLGADIISSSLVYNIFDEPGESYSKSDMDGRTSLVARAAEIAFMRGILVVNSAGNEGITPWRIITTPSDAEHVLAVGAVSAAEDGRVAVSDFSSRGPTADGRIKPDVVAPGENVSIPYPGTPGFYFYSRGTSLAAPLVAGLCALLYEAHPDWTPSAVMSAIKETSGDLGEPGPDNNYGWGIPDGVAAMDYIHTSVDKVEMAELELTGTGRKIPRPFGLLNPFPNPFNAQVTIPFRIYEEFPITVEVVDITGRMVATLFSGIAIPGLHHAVWNGATHASGVYFARAVSKNGTDAKKILLVK